METIGPYRLTRKLGEGGMGIVWAAEDTRLGRSVAIKLIRAGTDPSAGARLWREARAAASVNHPKICQLFDVGEHEGQVFLAMELLSGEPLSERIARGPLPLAEAVEIMDDVLDALGALHERSLVHRDLKPSNIMLTPRGAKLLDFGLALPLDGNDARLTRPGAVVGTPRYMAPEQWQAGEATPASDIFSCGAIFYEMLSGRPAFVGDSIVTIAKAIATEEPPPLAEGPELVPADRLIRRALAKNPSERFDSAALMSSALRCLPVGEDATARFVPAQVQARRPPRRLRARPAVVAGVVLLALSTALVAMFARQRSQERWARTEALPRAAALNAAGKPLAALRLIQRAEKWIADDPALRTWVAENLTDVRVETAPPGGEVSVRDFDDTDPAWEVLGTAPLDVRLPSETTLVARVSLEGYETTERLIYPLFHFARIELMPPQTGREGMVPVRSQPAEFCDRLVQLDGFWVDRYEVTNRQYDHFVASGGYRRPDLWRGVSVETIAAFRDSTGRPGPAAWEFGTYEKGTDDQPVSGVSWYEADAYCRSVGKELPTIFHWYAAASFAATTELAPFSNFLSNGVQNVGAPRTLGMNGTYDMAGNVAEWCWNDAGDGTRYALGGHWRLPSYAFVSFAHEPAVARLDTVGFRCIAPAKRVSADARAPIAEVFRDYRRESPVSGPELDELAAVYQYEKTPLDARVTKLGEQTEHWSVEKISYRAAYGDERVGALLFLPKNARPPYQVVTVLEPAGFFFPGQLNPSNIRWPFLLFILRSGRAAFIPEYKGSFERYVGDVRVPGIWREMTVGATKDLMRGIDYLETRSDVDAKRIGYFGSSMGGALGALITAVEPRIRSSILLGGGLYPWRREPEAEPFNFLGRVTAPTLMLNGRHDFYFNFELAQKPMFERLGTPPEHKKHVVYDSGHIPSEKDQWIRESLEWLDRYMGPVAPK